MTKKATAPQISQEPTLTAEDILNWITQNPAFLTQNAQALAALQPSGSNVTPLHAVRAVKAEQNHTEISKKYQKLIKTAQANTLTANAIFTLIPQVISCNTLPKLRKFLQTDVKHALDINAVRLLKVGKDNTATTLTQQEIEILTNGNPTHPRTLYTAEDRHLYGTTGKMMKSDALLQLNHNGHLLGLLALGSHDETRFHIGQGTELATFFGQVIAAQLSHVSG